MDLRITIPLLALFLLAKCENATKDVITDSNEINDENTTPKPAILCNVCACTGSRNLSSDLYQNNICAPSDE